MKQANKVGKELLQRISKIGISVLFLLSCMHSYAQNGYCNVFFHAFKHNLNNPRSYDFYIDNCVKNNLYLTIDFGDGSQPEHLQSPVYIIPHTYTSGGRYKVCLTTIDSVTKCIYTFCDSLSVTTCIADFTYAFDPPTNTVHFKGQANTNDTKYHWYFNGPNNSITSDLKDPSYKFFNTKYAYVYLITVSDSDPDCHDTIDKQLSELTGVSENNEQQLILENYPNPFSGSTTIHYTIRVSSPVEISVFDLLGNRVDLIRNDAKAPGDYTIEWNSQDLKEGMYLLQLKTADLSVTKKMIISN